MLRGLALVARHLHNFLIIRINFCSPAQLVQASTSSAFSMGSLQHGQPSAWSAFGMGSLRHGQPPAPELVEGAASRRRYKAT